MSETIDGAWAEVGERLRAFIGRRVDDPQDAEDLLHEVWLRLQRNAGALREAGGVPWLFRVTRNVVTDHHRARARRSRLGERLRAEGDPGAGGDPPGEGEGPGAVRRELARCLAPLVGTLPPHYREAVVLVEIDGAAQAEAARRLGMSVSGVKSRVQRGRRLLRERLLACCRVETDARGAPVGYVRKAAGCGCGSVAAGGGETGAAAGTGGCGCAALAPAEG